MRTVQGFDCLTVDEVAEANCAGFTELMRFLPSSIPMWVVAPRVILMHRDVLDFVRVESLFVFLFVLAGVIIV